MKFSLVFAAIASVVSAASSMASSMSAATTGAAALPPSVIASQIAFKLPQCALPCFTANVPKICPKGVTDYACQCAHQIQIRPLITPCVIANCTSQNDQIMAATIAAQVCSAFYKAQATVTGAMATVNVPTAVQFGPVSYSPTMNAAYSTGLPMLGAALGALAMAAL